MGGIASQFYVDARKIIFLVVADALVDIQILYTPIAHISFFLRRTALVYRILDCPGLPVGNTPISAGVRTLIG
jgi:hypothetical protein